MGKFIGKLRSLPESQKRLIMWTVIIFLAVVLFILWARGAKETLGNFPKEELEKLFRLPESPKIEVPQLEMPELTEEEQKQLEEQLKRMEEELKQM